MSDLPIPLVPAEVDLRDFAFMPLDVARLRDSDLASNETPESCWAAVLLWAASWHQVPAGSIPNDDRWIAKQAGYAHRGTIADEWANTRTGALRGFVKCSDGRLYHPVVAEKAREAWKGKLKQRHATECARIKKHNQRHAMSLPCPSFEEWLSLGCPWGQALPVPKDKEETRNDCPQDVPRETPSKGQGEGQGESIICPKPAPPVRTRAAYPEDFERFWTGYPTDPNMSKAEAGKTWARMGEADRAWAIAAIPAFAAHCRKTPDYRPLHAVRFLTQRRFEGFAPKRAEAAAGTSTPATADPVVDMGTGHKVRESTLARAVAAWIENQRSWKWHELGDEPDKPGCRVPAHILAAAGLQREPA